MERDILIKDMKLGDYVEGFYYLREAESKTTVNGKPFFNANISDISGNIDIKIWDYEGPVKASDAGKIIKIRGEVSEYKGNRQIKIELIRLATDNDNYDLSKIVSIAPFNADTMVGEIRGIISTFSDDDYRLVAEKMLERHLDAFSRIPAAKSVHHGFISGLLMHTYNMLKLSDFLSQQYSSIINRDLLLCGTLLHDFGKEREFTISPLGLVSDYSEEGQLIGHLVIGAMEIFELCRELNISEYKSMLLQHMILSHHGEPEYGAAVKPAFAEAELLSYVDLVDSRMEIYSEQLEKMKSGEFSQKLFSLDKKIYKPKNE